MVNNRWLTWKLIVPVCFRTDQNPFQEPKVHVSKHISSLRLSLTEISDTVSSSSPSSISNLSNSVPNLHVFTLKELEIVTRNFFRSNFLGEGGFGSVFKGFIDDKLRPGLKAQPVAVKVLDLDGTQGHREWLAEVVILGQLKHTHLVNLIGYCYENEQRLLVYEYMQHGNLENRLFKGYSATLPWLTRLKIAVGAAKGLAFLHEEDKPVIYRDFKASNILLDADFNAKLSDFGLATDGPDPEDDKSHVTTRVMGTEGYAAPEYIMTGHLTTMSDVYSFGVVLLELLTGRKSIDKKRPCREQNLVKWARPLLKDPHKLDQIMDPRLEGQYSMEGTRKAAEVAYQCLSHHPKSRPTMSNVVKTLEPLLDLKDIPIGPFVFIAASETNDNSATQEKHQESADNCLDLKTKKKSDGRGFHCHDRKGYGHRQPVKSLKTKAAYSDTDLYKTLGTDLYSLRQ